MANLRKAGAACTRLCTGAPPSSSRRSAERPPVTGVDIDVAPSLDAARSGWDELAEAAGNPFGTHAWCSAWWASVRPRAARSALVRVRSARRPGRRDPAALPRRPRRRPAAALPRARRRRRGRPAVRARRPRARRRGAEHAVREARARGGCSSPSGSPATTGSPSGSAGGSCASESSPVLAIEGAGLGRVARVEELELPPAGAALRAQARQGPRPDLPPDHDPATPRRRPRDALRAPRPALGGRRRDRGVRRGPARVPPRLRDAPRSTTAWLRLWIGGGRRRAGRRLVRPAPRRPRVVLPARPRPAVGPGQDRLRPAGPHHPQRVRGRHGELPLRPRRRGVQGPLRHPRPRARHVHRRPGAAAAGPAAAAIKAARRLPRPREASGSAEQPPS